VKSVTAPPARNYGYKVGLTYLGDSFGQLNVCPLPDAPCGQHARVTAGMIYLTRCANHIFNQLGTG